MPDQDPPDKVSKFYQNLLSDGYTEKNLGSEDDFRSALSDPTKSAKIYNNLLSDGYTVKNLGGMDQFLSTFNKSNNVSQRPSSYPIKQEGFAANINMGEAQKPLPINLHPDQPQVQQQKQQEAPSIENNFGVNHNQIASEQQPVQDNTTNVQPQESLNKVDFDVNHVARVKEKEDFTNRAIDDATQRSLKIKGINAQPGSVQYNQQRDEFLKQVQNGDAAPVVKNGEVGLSRTTGFLENLKKGWNDATTAADEANDFANNMTAEQRVAYLNKKQSESQPTPYIGEKADLKGSAAHFISSSIPFLGKAGAGAVIGAGAVAAAPESMGASLSGLPVAMSSMLTAGDMANQGVQQEVTRRFEILKKEHPERTDVENMEEAGKGALAGGVVGILENAAMVGTALKTPIMAESKSLIGQTVNKIANSSAHLGAITAGVTAAEQEVGNLQGVKTSQADILKNSVNAGVEGATTGALLTAYMHLPYAPKILKSVFKDAIVKNSDPQTITNALQANENMGNIPLGTTQKVTQDLNGYREALNKIPDGLSPESQASIAGLIQKKNNLIEEAKTKDDSFKDFYDTQIKSIDGQISDIQRTGKPLEHEIDEATGKPYEQPTYDDVAQQRVQDLADKISKGKKLEPEDLQTQQIFPDQLKDQLKNIVSEETKSNEGKENPNTEVVDNVNKFLSDNEKPVQPNTDEVSRETKDISKENNLTEKENKLSSQNEIKKDESQKSITEPVPSSESEGESGSELQKAANITGRVHQTGKEIKDEFTGSKRDGKELEQHAKDEGLFISPEDFKKEFGDKPDNHGVESDVYLSKDGKSVYKVNNGLHHGNWNEFFNRIKAHNEYFPDTKYEISGYTKKDGSLAIILKQPHINIERSATPEEIKSDLEKRGFEYHGENDVRDNDNGVILRDLHKENAVINDAGNVTYIDPLIQFTKDSKFLKENLPVEKENVDKENVTTSTTGKEIEPHPEVNTDFETVAKELKLTDLQKRIYQELKDVKPEERERELESMKDNRDTKEDVKSEIESLQSEHDGIFDKMDEVDQSDMTDKQKKAKITRLKSKQKQIKLQLEDAESRLKNVIDDHDGLFGYDVENVNELIDKVNSRIKIREGIKSGSDLFPAEANIPEIKLNKAEESLAKRKITNAGADKILEDGMTKETLEANKEVFDGGLLKKEDYNEIKTYLDETGRNTKQPEENGQENISDDGNKGSTDKSESVPSTETKDATGESNAGAAAEEPAVTADKEPLGKVAFARSNSYDSYKLLHPKESVEDYNKVRNSDVEIPTGDLRKLSKEYVKDNSKESYSTEKFYNEVAGSKPTKTGRIPVAPIIGKAKDLSKIILDVSNSLNQKISFLKAGRRRALGSYSPGNAGIKIKFTGDLDVTAHEIGHSIDDNFGILRDLLKTPDKEIEKELKKFSPFGSKPPKGADAKKYTMGEGFAEWLRAYIVNPDEAIKQAPKLYDLYKSKVSEDYQKSLTNFSNDVRTWAGSTGRDMVLSNIEWEPEKAKGLMKEIFGKKDNDMFSISFADKLAANWVNPMRAFEKAFNYARGIKGVDEVLPENDPTILARLFLSIDRKFGEFLEGGLRDSKDRLTSKTPRTFKWLIEPLDNTDMSTIKREMQDVTAYMVAERTVELGNRFKREEILTGIGGGIYKDVNVAKKALEEFSGDPEKLERIQEAANRYREFADDNLKYMVEKGRLSKESYDEIKKNNLQYVALHRIMEAEPESEIQVFKGGSKNISSVSQPVQSIKGSTKKISNPYSSLLDSMYRSIKESDRNEVMKSFRDMLVNNRGMYEGDPKKLSEIGVLAKSGDKNAITIFVDGKPEKWVFQKDVYDALKGLDHEAYKLPRIATFYARTLRSMTTKFPTFALRNWIRDLQDRLIKSNDHSGLKDLFGNKEHWQDVARKGGLNSGYYVRDKAHYYGLMEQAMDELSKKQKTIFADPIKIKKLWHGYESILQASETSNRVAEYRAAFRQAKKKGMDDYNAGLYGAFKSRDLMDFAVAGHYMRILNQIIPFSNAAVQGVRSGLVRAHENPLGFLARTAVVSVLPQVALWWWNHRDDETAKQYEQMPAYQKDMFFNLKIGDNKWLSIPKPYELGMLAAGVDRSLSSGFGYNKNAFEGYAGDVFKAISPVDQSTLFGPAEPIIETLANYDEFRDKHIISPEEDALDLSLRHTETASWLSQQIQKVAPIDARKMDFLIRSQFSYVGNEGLKLTDKAASLAGADIATNRNDFDLTDLGVFKRSPAYNAQVVQDMMQFAKQWRLDRSREYKEFKGIAAKYFDTEDNSEKEKYSQQMIDLAQNLLDTWKAQGVEEKVKEKEKNKRLKNQK